MKTIRVEGPEGNTIDLPVATRVNRATQPAYKLLLLAAALFAAGALAQNPSPLLWFGAILFALPLPVHIIIESKIKQTDWSASKRRRNVLFGAEMMPPLLAMPAVAAIPTMLQSYGLSPTEGQIAVVISGVMLMLALTNVLANRAWALGLLGLER